MRALNRGDWVEQMADSDFWSDLAERFRALAAREGDRELRSIWSCALDQNQRASTKEWSLIATGPDSLGSAKTVKVEFEALARRGGITIDPSIDSLDAWLEAVSQELPENVTRGEGTHQKGNGDLVQHRFGTVNRLCAASADFCKILEVRALEAERKARHDEQQKSDPKRWSPLRQNWEALKEIHRLRTGSHEEMPEAFVRRILADQYGVKPEEVTWKQIQFEMAGLLQHYPAVRLVRSQARLGGEESAPETEQQIPASDGQLPTGRPASLNFPESDAIRKRNANLNAWSARHLGRNGPEFARQEELIEDAREWAKAELRETLSEMHDVHEIRERIVKRTWDEFVPRHRNYSDFKLGYRQFASALWEEGLLDDFATQVIAERAAPLAEVSMPRLDVTEHADRSSNFQNHPSADVHNFSTANKLQDGEAAAEFAEHAIGKAELGKRRKRGRPAIPDDRKQKALAVKGGKARAQILYNTRYPSAQQIKNVRSILRHYERTHRNPE